MNYKIYNVKHLKQRLKKLNEKDLTKKQVSKGFRMNEHIVSSLGKPLELFYHERFNQKQVSF